MPEKRSAGMLIKASQQEGHFEGLLASYNTVDLGGDKIMPGAFTKTIQERPTVPCLWQHDSKQPIGNLTLVDKSDGLYVVGDLVMQVPKAQEAWSLIKANVVKGMSIGYDTVKDSIDNGVRLLKEVRLWEGSIVTFPMNQSCMVTSMKSLSAGGSEYKGDFVSELSQIQLQDAGYQMRYALFDALGSIVWENNLSNDEKVAAAKTSIEQFEEAFMAFFPKYLSWLSGDMQLMGRMQMEEKAFAGIIDRAIKNISVVREVKEGKKHSAATVKSMHTLQGHVKDMDDILCTLLDDGADDDTEVVADDTPKSAAVPETKTEPAVDHSAAATQTMVEKLMSLYR
jgi:HK97 family phage prohead protease